MTADPADRDPDLSAADADLIAYLDGELDPAAAAVVEERLAADPKARAQAEAYRKTFNLLDYLPKAEPSPEFATRTLTSLRPALAATGSSVSASALLPHPRSRRLEPLLWVAGAFLAAALGFLLHLAAHTDPTAARPDEPLTDLPVIERLPLYLGVDDLDFLKELNKSDLFDLEDDLTPSDPAAALPDLAPSPATREKLIDLFRSLSGSRRQQLRTLHQQVTDPTLNDRDALLRTLEGYAVWLDRLPSGERKRVLDAAPGRRMEAVFEVHASQWRESLSEPKRQALREVKDAEERADLIRKYKEQEKARRSEWELARRQWNQLTDKNQPPWPFNDADLTVKIDEYIKTAFGIDPAQLDKTDLKNIPQSCRLTREELMDLRLRREAAPDGYWLSYGALLLRLSEAHEMLPRPKGGEPITQLRQLPPGYREGGGKAKALAGKWPDFALEARYVPGPFGPPRYTPLGPCKPDDLSEPIREFIQKKLTAEERDRLRRWDGRWPEYPRELIRVAREKNLSVPETMLPGEPNKWKQYYQLPSGKR